MKTLFKVLLAGSLALFSFEAAAQVSNGRATTTAPSYANNSTAPLSLDTAGNLRVNCIVGCGGGGGGGDVNIAGVLGNPPSATNPLWFAPATGATFPVSGTFWQATQPVSGPLTDTQLRATPVPVSGTFWQTTQPVSGTFWQATQPVSGPQTDAQFKVSLPVATNSAAISGASAATVQLVALSGSLKIYVTSFDVISAGAGNFTLVYGTGTNCGTGTTPLTGAYPLVAQAGIAKGSGAGPILVVPAGNALCWTNSAAVQMSGSVSYAQF